MNYILAIDQGTSSTKTVVFDEEGRAVAKSVEPLHTIYMENGFVEQDPEEIIQNVLASVAKCLHDFKSRGGGVEYIKACGISNQRETFVLWDKNGKPLHNAVVWQCKRSIEICEGWLKSDYATLITSKTGLVIDPYFSGTKVQWLVENSESIKSAVNSGNAYFGTIDTWLLFRLTNGESYFTDLTNASRTLFFDLQSLAWDDELLQIFGLSSLNLPTLMRSSASFGKTDFMGLLPSTVAITSLIGDSHAAAFGEGCFETGNAKATLGTGCSVLMNIGVNPGKSGNGMVSTICWSTEEKVEFALEGVIVSCGATIEWLRNELGLFASSQETQEMADAVADNGGVYLVPAFSGLGAPHWNMNRKASISGLTFGSGKNHLVRAALESIPFQIRDVIDAMESDAGIPLRQLMVDGGISENQFVVQYLADLLQKPVVNIGQPDVSALGAAYLAGLKSGVYKSIEQLSKLNHNKKIFQPSGNTGVATAYEGWKQAILNHS
jgi:glycerol kinase